MKVIDAEGQEIPWNQVSRIDQNEMKTLMIGVVNRVHTFLARTIVSESRDVEFERAVEMCVAPWIKNWDEPQFLNDFLMPSKEEMKK